MYYVGWLYFCVQELLYLKNCRRCLYLFTYTPFYLYTYFCKGFRFRSCSLEPRFGSYYFIGYLLCKFRSRFFPLGLRVRGGGGVDRFRIWPLRKKQGMNLAVKKIRTTLGKQPGSNITKFILNIFLKTKSQNKSQYMSDIISLHWICSINFAKKIWF